MMIEFHNHYIASFSGLFFLITFRYSLTFIYGRFLTGMIVECHHVLQKTLTGTMDDFHHVLQKTDLLTGTMDEFHHVLQKTFSLGWWSNVTMSYRRLSHWDDGRIPPCLTEGWLTHCDDGRISPCLTEDLFTEMIVKFHHVLQKTCSLGRWTTFTMSYTRFTHWGDGRISPCLTEDSHRDDERISPCLTEDWLTHWDNGRSSPCLTEDLLTEKMDECHHVLQKIFSLEWLSNFTMSYRRLTDWDDGRISPCLTEDLIGTMDEFLHVLQKTD